MASVKPRSTSRSRGVDMSRSKRAGGVMETSRDKLPPSLIRMTRWEEENRRLEASSVSRSRSQSRIPQKPAVRRPSGSTGTRPPLTHENQPWSSPSSGSGRPGMNTVNPPSPVFRDMGLKQPRNVLRRKQSTVAQETDTVRNNSRSNSASTSSSSSIPRLPPFGDVQLPWPDRSHAENTFETQVAQKFDPQKAVAQNPTVYPELDRYRDVRIPRDESSSEILFRLATHDLPPPTPLFSGTSTHSQVSTFSGSPSTRFSESPGPGPYSRDTTPTSISSASPGLVAPIRNPAPRVKQASPAETRPPVTRRRAGSVSNDNDAFSADTRGLPPVRETLTSSSSNSTVRDADKRDNQKRGLSPHAPHPPPRKSSQKFKKDRDDTDESPSKPARVPAPPVMRSPSPVKRTQTQTPGEKNQRAVSSPQQFRQTPPSRPSRDGTPDLYYQFGGPMPIIHSNLSSNSLTDRRQSGQLAPSSLPRSARSSKAPIGREPTPAPRSTSALNTERPKPEAGRVARTPSPGVSSFRSRFGLFGRRTKTDTDISRAEKKDRPPRKGPAAGTGHEGYGRIGAVKRRSSNVANHPRGLTGPVSSSESLASAQSADPFLLQRLNPVIIAGGEVVENQNDLNRTESNQSLPVHGYGVDSHNGSSASLSSREDARTTLWPSVFPHHPVQSRRRPSDSSDSEAVTMKSTLAFRRSVQRLRSSPEQEPLKLPKPIKTRGIASPPVGSIDDTAIVTDDSMADSRPEANHGPSTAPKKLTKRIKTPHKWNLFSRSHNQLDKAPKTKDEAIPTNPTAAVAAVPRPDQRKPMAYYTMMDSSEQEDAGEPDVNDVLREAEVLRPNPPLPSSPIKRRERSPSLSNRHEEQLPRHQATRQIRAPSQTRDIPQPSTVKTTPKPVGPTSRDVPKASAGRPSRLPQVGRIPKVVNSRPEQTSPKSFSRPFNRVSLQLPPVQVEHMDRSSVAKGPSPERPLTPEMAQDDADAALERDTGDYFSSDHDHGEDATPQICQPAKEFLVFSPRNNSAYTTSSTSSSSEIPSFANHIAVVPEPSAPLAEDEIWDEYNDFLGEVPPSATSSKGIPFHLEVSESKSIKKVWNISEPLESPTFNDRHAKEMRDSIETGKAATSSSHFSADMTARINAAFRFGPEPPSAPFSISEFVSGYGDSNYGAESSKAHVASQRSSSSSNRASRLRVSNSSATSEETPLSQVNLRVGSMTVSKWLTFGHVLFSPARDDLDQIVGSLKRHSVLVIDGLGNDDWSFYAAETYPAATFFNLSPRAPLTEEHRSSSSSFPLAPSNHHQIQYLSHKDKLPFGPDSFTTVVFRFPSAAPESWYRNIISEAHRVLKPGGYVELAILDVDLNNMGNRSRRAVRRLKERINIQNPDINLSSTSDLMLRLLGRKGFVDIKTCRVGVPVASTMTKSTGGEGGSGGSGGGAKGEKKKTDERSLAEMMNDETEMGDANITKMVAKVGRWWYHRLYENSTGINGSIWNDKALLGECEEWGTSLKLMVCHARIPETRTRVSSI